MALHWKNEAGTPIIKGVGAKRRITHSFTPDEDFLKALVVEAKLGLGEFTRARARGGGGGRAYSYGAEPEAKAPSGTEVVKRLPVRESRSVDPSG